MIAPIGETAEQDGVIATRPATTPEAAPSEVEWPSRNFSTTNQPSVAAPVATMVLTHTTAAVLLAASADPALKPNQPNHSRPAPIMTRGRLCGRIGSRRQPSRRPRTSAIASPAAPELISTAVPPAKSRAPSRSPIHPPFPPSKKKTQWATGTYTNVAQRATNTHQALNLA